MAKITAQYNAEHFGGKREKDMMTKFILQRDDAKLYFQNCIKPRLDRSYKLYIAYNGDRKKEIKQWQSNVFVPYIQAVVETLMPRILDARPEFTVQGRTEEDQYKAIKVQQLGDYSWEKANMDATTELVTRAALVYGSGYLQASWKRDVRDHKFLKSKDLSTKRYSWVTKKQTYYDAPYAEWVDNYGLWYDWHNIDADLKQFWFKRLILTGAAIKRRYPMYDEERMNIALNSGGENDLTDYGSVRYEVKLTHEEILKGSDYSNTNFLTATNLYADQDDPDLKMFEVFEWTRPFEDKYAVIVSGVPIFKKAEMPILYDFKEAPFISIPYLKLPNEFEGYGLPLMLESPQILLNLIKNQRLDAVTMSIHKMWVVNPLSNVKKEELVVRPFGIIYSPDPNAVREVSFSDVKGSAYREEDLLKSDMRYASGVDDFSMGAGAGASSATEVRHLRESTLERVRLFVNHLGDGYAKLLRLWISMYKQFFTDEMIIKITGEDGKLEFPLIEKDDLTGEFDFKATVIPALAGQNEVEKKQNMDLFQLLINLPFVDPQKLTTKVLHPWNWSLDSVTKEQEEAMPGMGEGPGATTTPEGAPAEMLPMPTPSSGMISPEIAQAVLGSAYPGGQGSSPFSEAAMPIDLLAGGMPPTPQGVPVSTTNPRGMSRSSGAGVNTNIPLTGNYSEVSKLMNRANNIQR